MDASDPPVLAGLTVGLIEDDLSLAAALTAALEARGARCLGPWLSVGEAQPALLRQPPALAIIDYRLRGAGTGIDLACWMQATPGPDQTVRVL